MVSALESPVHDNWKRAIVDAGETDTVFLNRFQSPGLRALRTQRTSALERQPDVNAMAEFGKPQDLYFGGDMEAAIPLTGQVCGRIESIRPVAEILGEICSEFEQTLARLQSNYPPRGQ
jgi:enoyl-[acyl-carrier protein] reductase II